MGLSVLRWRAGPLNPRTPARPDLKSGAVVLAWLPPRAFHRACGRCAFGWTHEAPAHAFSPGERRRCSLPHGRTVIPMRVVAIAYPVLIAVIVISTFVSLATD